MRKALLTTLLAVLLAYPATAGAASRWVVKGGGWGHGIGMSQYGAYGMAQDGKSYKEILTHFYTGTEVSRADTQTIRVLLQQNRKRTTFTGATPRRDAPRQAGEDLRRARVRRGRRRHRQPRQAGSARSPPR